MRRSLALALSCLLLLAVPAVAGGPNHVVLASPNVDGQRIARANVQVASTGADMITSTNLASATPTGCTGCEGVAVAFQALIVKGSPSKFAPVNAAVAVNSNCTSCGAFAFAYQYAVSADHARLDADTRQEVADIRAEADDLVAQGLPYSELDAKLTDLGQRFKAAVSDGLEQTGADPHGGRAVARTDEEPAPAGS